MHDRLITVATFSGPIESHMFRARLEAEGIWCSVADEHLVSANWFYSNAVGGVKLQVRESDLDDARRVVAAEYARRRDPQAVDWSEVDPSWTFDGEAEPADAVCCPRCGSTEVFYEKFSRPLIFLSILLLGVPIPFLSRRWTCRRCELRWKMKLFR